VETLQTVPGLGEKKSRKILETSNLNNLVNVSNASVGDLSKAVDVNAARAIHNFFNLPTNA
jgi:excinuclease UvrABC nuclease subunit